MPAGSAPGVGIPTVVQTKSEKWYPRLTPLGLLGAIAAFNLWTLLKTPAPFVDEAWGASRAVGLLQTGHPFGVLDSGVFERYPGYWTTFPWLGTFIHAVAIRALGLSLQSIRLVSLVFGLLLLVEVYVLTTTWWHRRRTAVLAVVLVALSFAFITSSHLARHDIIVAAFGFGAFILYERERPGRIPIQSFLAGLLVGLTLDVHPNGAIYGPAIATFAVAESGLTELRRFRFWAFALGISLGLAYFVSMHVLPYPQTYRTLTQPFIEEWRKPPFLTASLSVWLDSLLDFYGGLITWISGFRFPLVAIAAWSFARKGTHPDRKALLLFGALSLATVAVIRYKTPDYAILLSPAADILVAALLVRAVDRPRTPLQRLWLLMGYLLTLASVAFSLAPLVLSSPFADYHLAVARIQTAVIPGRSIIGPQTYWIDLRDHPYQSWEQLIYYQDFTPGATLEDAFRALHPDYFVIDRDVSKFVASDCSKLTAMFRFLCIPETDLRAFLGTHAVLVATLDTPTYGHLEIYEINWNTFVR